MAQDRLRVGILTSGGDAPGMNAVIRAVVRTGEACGMQVYGIRHGFEGLLRADMHEVSAEWVADIIYRGGTVLRTARCADMLTEAGQQRAAGVIATMRLDALIIAGGDGSFKGAQSLARLGVNVMGIPATIDLDMPCTEYSVGFDTAVNTVTEAIIRIRDTSSSHERCSVVEVMGRDAGHLAMWCGLTGGAEEVLIPEKPLHAAAVIEQIIANRSKGKRHHLIVVAEGVGGSDALAKEIEKTLGIESRATVLGHLQRGGTPTALDRMHGSMMGYHAVKAIESGEQNKAVLFRQGRYVLVDLEEAINTSRTYNPEIYDITKILSV